MPKAIFCGLLASLAVQVAVGDLVQFALTESDECLAREGSECALNALQTKAATSSSQLVVPTGHRYNVHKGLNCYGGHGGFAFPPNSGSYVDLSKPYEKPLSVESCGSLCESIDGSTDASACFCFTYNPSTGQCYIRHTCEPRQCVQGSPYDTYVKTGLGPPKSGQPVVPIGHRYNIYKGLNCYGGHGGFAFPPNSGSYVDLSKPYEKPLSAESCGSLCESIDGSTDASACSCFTYNPSTRQCYIRHTCEPRQCVQGSPYDTYVKP